MKPSPQKTFQTGLLILALLSAPGLSAAPRLRFLSYTGRSLKPGAWTAGKPLDPRSEADLNGDGISETIHLQNGTVTLLSGEDVFYASKPGWQVRQAEFADLNGDDRTELVLLVWRPFQPWPVDRLLPAGGRIAGFHDADGLSCHLILLGWSKGGIREVWAGSALAEPVLTFVIADLDGNGKQELVTLEGDYAYPTAGAGNGIKIWEWNGFGFTRLEQIDLPARQIIITQNAEGSRGLLVELP